MNFALRLMLDKHCVLHNNSAAFTLEGIGAGCNGAV